jgi:PAS domain S-box-containing protein
MSGRDESGAQLARHVEATQAITHIGSWQFDLATHAVSWSDELYRIYGLAPRSREITFDVFLSFVDPADRGRIQALVGAAIESGGRFAYRERIVRADGEPRELDTVGEAMLDEGGRVIGLIGTCRDITEQLAREETIRVFGDIVENIDIGLCVWRVESGQDVGAATLRMHNAAAEKVLGIELDDAGTRPMRALLPNLPEATLAEIGQVMSAARARDLTPFEVPSADGAARTISLRAFPLPVSRVGLAFEDITAAVRARRLHAEERRVLEMIASGRPLGEVLDAVVRMIEDHARPTIGSVLLLDPDGARVRHGAAPSLPEAFNRAVDGSEIGPLAGSCGTAAYLREPVFVDDIETDPRWASYRELARQSGLRACWSAPIFTSDGRVGGTFALYYREPRRATQQELELIARVSHLAGIAIQRKEIDDQQRALSAHIEAAREEERTSLAREIHDELGQALTALKMDLAWIGRRLAGDGAATSTGAITAKLGTMSTLTDGVIDTVRRISSELRPGLLDDLGLVAAIEWQAQQFEERTGASCVVRAELGDARLGREVSTTLFRIFQEALTNVARHAEASSVEVLLERDGERLRLTVRDDGIGASDEAIARPSSLGLLGMRERARRIGGTFTVRGADGGRGTTCTVEVPLAARGSS